MTLDVDFFLANPERERQKGELIIMWICRGGMQGEMGKLCSIYVISTSATYF
jgi:hypothetical protein